MRIHLLLPWPHLSPTLLRQVCILIVEALKWSYAGHPMKVVSGGTCQRGDVGGGGATTQVGRGSPCTGHGSYALPRCGTPPHGESSAEPATGMRNGLLTGVWRTGGTASCWCLYLGVSQREDCEAWHTRIRPCMHMLNLCGQDLMRCHGARATGGASWDADAVGAH